MTEQNETLRKMNVQLAEVYQANGEYTLASEKWRMARLNTENVAQQNIYRDNENACIDEAEFLNGRFALWFQNSKKAKVVGNSNTLGAISTASLDEFRAIYDGSVTFVTTSVAGDTAVIMKHKTNAK